MDQKYIYTWKLSHVFKRLSHELTDPKNEFNLYENEILSMLFKRTCVWIVYTHELVIILIVHTTYVLHLVMLQLYIELTQNFLNYWMIYEKGSASTVNQEIMFFSRNRYLMFDYFRGKYILNVSNSRIRSGTFSFWSNTYSIIIKQSKIVFKAKIL